MSTSRGKELVMAACVWLNEKVSVVPAQPRSKVVNLRWRRFETNPPSVDLIQHWFQAGVNNLAVIGGTGNLLVLDFDDLAHYKVWKEKAGALVETYTESTGRGMHVFFKVDRPETRKFNECEALGLGHLCLVYPSIHPTGAVYFPVGDLLTPIMQVSTSEIFSLLSEPLPARNLGEHQEAINKSYSAPPINGGDVISRIKAAKPIVEYAGTLTQLSPCGQGGRYLHGRCPFHDDKEASFIVDSQRGLWRCYSPSCKATQNSKGGGGDILNLYALANNITVHEAIKRLAREVL